MKSKLENRTLTVFLEGRINSFSAPTVEAEINDIRAKKPAEAIVLDCENLQYVSSAGLRVILRTKKLIPNTKLINVSDEVYDILDVTGFVEMMEVERAYREISIDGCEAIGEGANGKVYRLTPDAVVKVYRNADALPEIQRERELARTAFVLGVPTAIPYRVVRIKEGGYGSVFELLNATNFAKLLTTGQKTLDEIAKMSVDLLKTIHTTEVKPNTMPSMREEALGWVDYLKGHLPVDSYEKLYRLIEAVPENYHMLHGDFHLKNIMYQGGETLILDMDTLCHGHPVFELAFMFNAYRGHSELDHEVVKSFLGIDYETAEQLWRKTLEQYLGTTDPQAIREVEDKAKVVGYMRLLRRCIRLNGYDSESGRKKIECYRALLEKLLPCVDSLTF